MERGDARWVRRILLGLLFLVPLVPNPGLLTNVDLLKWAVLTAGLLAVLALVLVRALRSGESIRVPFPETVAGVVLLALAGLAIGKRAPDAVATIVGFARIGSLGAFGVLAARYFRDDDHALGAFRAVAAAAVLAAALAIAGPWGWSSTFGNPTFTAEFLAPVVALAVFLRGGRNAALTRALGATAAIGLLPMFLAGESRADLVALAAALLAGGALAFLARRARPLPPARLATGLLAAILSVPYVFQALPVLFGPSETVEVRERIRDATFEMVADHAGSGVGIEGFRAQYPKYRQPAEVRLSLRREVTFPHNLPLSVAAETGIPGLVLLLAFLWVTLWSGVRSVIPRRDDPIALGALAGVVAILVSAQLAAPLRHPASALLFFLLAGVLVARRPKRFVTDLKGRYRRAFPVMLLLAPVLAGAAHLVPTLAADRSLARAVDLEARLQGGMDKEVSRLLERSARARPTPEALRQLAFYRNGTGEPERALALIDEKLFAISPFDEWGRIERARALLILDRTEEALGELDLLAAARPGDDGVLFLRAKARWATGETAAALPDLYTAVKLAPVAAARRYAAWANDLPDYVKDGLIRVGERIAADDLRRGLAVLEALTDWRSRYAGAVLLAGRGELDWAMEVLRAIRADVPREMLAADPRLDPLRGRADFRTLTE